MSITLVIFKHLKLLQTLLHHKKNNYTKTKEWYPKLEKYRIIKWFDFILRPENDKNSHRCIPGRVKFSFSMKIAWIVLFSTITYSCIVQARYPHFKYYSGWAIMPMITGFGPWMDKKKTSPNRPDEVYLTAVPEVTVLFDTKVIPDTIVVKGVTLHRASIQYSGLDKPQRLMSLHQSEIVGRGRRRIKYIFNSVYIPPDISVITIAVSCAITTSSTESNTACKTEHEDVRMEMIKTVGENGIVWLPEKNPK